MQRVKNLLINQFLNMNQKKINNQIFERLKKIEEAFFDQNKIKEKQTKIARKRNKTESLESPIMKLFNSGFFKEIKIDKDVLFELQKRLLTKQKPLRPSIVNVLRSMVRKDLLGRMEIQHGKKKLIGYKNKS